MQEKKEINKQLRHYTKATSYNRQQTKLRLTKIEAVGSI